MEELKKAIDQLESQLQELKRAERGDAEALSQQLEARKARLEAELETAKARRASGEHKA